MKFAKAIKAIQNFKKVRLASWEKGAYIEYGPNIKFQFCSGIGVRTLNLYDVISDDWEVYEQTYTFAEAFAALKEGKTIFSTDSKVNTKYKLIDGKIAHLNPALQVFCIDNKRHNLSIPDHEMLSDNWVIE